MVRRLGSLIYIAKFHVFIWGKKNRKILKIEKLPEKNVEIMAKQLFDKNDPWYITP